MTFTTNTNGETVNGNTEVIREWVAALRSGKYQQTGGKLARTVGDSAEYCCLGVLCELGAAKGIATREEAPGTFFQHIKYDGLEALPPGSIQAWVGLDSWGVSPREEWSIDPDDLNPDGRISVAALNDRYDFTFDQIADAVESEYL